MSALLICTWVVTLLSLAGFLLATIVLLFQEKFPLLSSERAPWPTLRRFDDLSKRTKRGANAESSSSRRLMRPPFGYCRGAEIHADFAAARLKNPSAHG